MTTREEIVIGAALFVAGLAVSLVAAIAVLVRLPADYFGRTDRISLFPERPPWFRRVARIGKNVLGAALVALGVVLSIPGVPGQGLLTILVGLMLLDLPGKRRFERRIVSIRAVRHALDKLRGRLGRPPFELDDNPPGAHDEPPTP